MGLEIPQFFLKIQKDISALIYQNSASSQQKRITQNTENFIVSLDRGNFIRSKKGLIDIISNHMCITSQQMIKQTAPPYQRILLAIKAR